MNRPEAQPAYDYAFRLHAYHEYRAAEIGWHFRQLMVKTGIARHVLHTVPVYTMSPYNSRSKRIPRDTVNQIRAHATAARRIENRVNGHA